MRTIVLALTVAVTWGDVTQAAGPPACRPLRPAPVAAASAVEIRVEPDLPPELAPAPAVPEGEVLESPGADADLPTPIIGGPENVYVQRVAPAPWAWMRCVPPAPCRTPCYADCIPCEARVFRSTAPKCHHQAIHLSFRDAIWNALDLPHAMHECCRKYHNTFSTPNPYARPYPYENACK